MIVDQAIYRRGRREPCGDLSDALDALRADDESTDFLWIGLKDPTSAEFGMSFGLFRRCLRCKFDAAASGCRISSGRTADTSAKHR